MSEGFGRNHASEPLQLLLLGTGTSTSLPLPPCLCRAFSYPPAWAETVPLPTYSEASPPGPGHFDPAGPWPTNIECACCRATRDEAVPEGWKNERGNTSCIVRKRGSDGRWRNVLVDVGKTFIEQSKKYFPRWGVQTIDAVILTHGHADAYFGLDDLREWCYRQGTQIPIYLNQPTYEIVGGSFPYLIDKTKASGGGDVPQLTWHIIDDDASFDVEGIHVQSIPVHHGVYFRQPEHAPDQAPTSPPAPEPLICLAFKFDDSILYMSDVGHIPDPAWSLISGHSPRNPAQQAGEDACVQEVTGRGGHPLTVQPTFTESGPNTPNAISPSFSRPPSPPSSKKLAIFLVDTLFPLRPHTSHFSFRQALAAAHRVDPSITYMIGHTHPVTHFMWEELGRRIRRKDGHRADHPEYELARGLVEKVWSDKQFSDEGEGLGRKIEEWGGLVEPGWDGLVVEVGGSLGEGEYKIVEGPCGTVRPRWGDRQ